jgi:quercetin dioxygenase-like cupin family protein
VTLHVRTTGRDGPLVDGVLGAISVHALGIGAELVEEPDVESAVVVLGGAVDWAGEPLGPGDGVHGRCRVTATAADTRVLVLHGRHATPDRKGVRWHYAPARGTDDRLLRAEGGFTDMGVRWLATADTVGARGLVVATSTFEPGGHHGLHRHPHADEFFLVLRGGGHHLAPDGPIRLDPGDLVHVPAGEPHGYRTDPGTVTTALYGYLGAGSLDQAGYELELELELDEGGGR